MRTTPPPPGKVKNVDYPQVGASTLENGLSVLSVEDRYLPRVSVVLALPVGRAHDPEDRLGLSQLAFRAVKEGTQSKSALDIAAEFDRLAIDFDSDVSSEYSTMTLRLLEDQLEAGLDLLSELILRPTFPEVEVDRIKTRWRSHLLAQRSDPSFLANERLAAEIFAEHPYSKVSMLPEHLDRIGRHDLREFHRVQFSPRSAFLLFAGAIRHRDAHELAGRVFAEWDSEAAGVIESPSLQPIPKRRVCIIHRPNSVQSTIAVGLRTITRASPDFLKLKLANQVLGGGASSRIFLNLRERRGYTYGAYSSLKAHRHHGVLRISTNVKADKTTESLQEIFAEIDRLCESPPADDELLRCKSEIIGAFLRRMELPGSIGQMEVSRRLMALPEDYHRTFIPAVQAVTGEEARGVFRGAWERETAVACVVGDREVISEGLSSLGSLSFYDTEGRPL